MRKSLSIAILSLASAAGWADARLTEVETRWLSAGAAVLDYAEAQSLPIDVIVQPHSQPGAAPLAMGFDNGRCKLVLSLRGNLDAETVLANIAPAQADLAIEAMVAHEVGHCWRFMNGAAQTSPANFSSSPNGLPASTRQAESQKMEQTRREEGLADLVGLAWTLRQHPEQYPQVHAWLEQVRKAQSVPGSHHDTRLWVGLAEDASAFEADKTPFEQARALFEQACAL